MLSQKGDCEIHAAVPALKHQETTPFQTDFACMTNQKLQPSSGKHSTNHKVKLLTLPANQLFNSQ
eukprot:2106407-Amphidinium_carterae.1